MNKQSEQGRRFQSSRSISLLDKPCLLKATNLSFLQKEPPTCLYITEPPGHSQAEKNKGNQKPADNEERSEILVVLVADVAGDHDVHAKDAGDEIQWND